MIRVNNLTKVYGENTVVKGLNFEIESGKIYGFLGPNGAGKSTTMNMITGCLAPTDGEVYFDGVDIFDDPILAKKKIGYLPENPPLYPDMTPFEYLMFVCQAKGVKAQERIDAVYDVMEQTDILEMKDRLIKNLSKGYRQRVGIAQAMLGDPEVIILDEPTVGLDPKQIMKIRQLIKDLGKNRTVILSSHILAEVSAVCDHVMIIRNGNLIASDTLENIRINNSPENLLLISAKTDENGINEVLDGFKGSIVSIKTKVGEDGYTDAEIELETGCDIREELSLAFGQKGIALKRLIKHSPSLEEIFLSLTESEYEEDDEYEDDDECDDDDEYDDDDDEEDDEAGEYKPLFSTPLEDEE